MQSFIDPMQKGMSLFLSYTNMIKHQCECLIQLLKQIRTSGESLANLCKCLIVFPYPSRLWFTFVFASWIISEFENSWSKWMTLRRKLECWFEIWGNLYIFSCLFVCFVFPVPVISNYTQPSCFKWKPWCLFGFHLCCSTKKSH